MGGISLKVAIIGGGASGLAAAVTAARRGAQVIVLEQKDRVGKKLLATGNGRCNFSNRDLSLAHYHGDAAFVKAVLEKVALSETLQFFESIGLVYREEAGRLYPYSNHASSVLDALRLAAACLSVREETGFAVCRVEKRGGRFVLSAPDGRELHADRVIVASGGKASPSLGSNGGGYALLRSFGHTITRLYPSLVQLKTAPGTVKGMKGIRVYANARLYQTAGGGSPCRQTKGGESYQTAGGESPCRQTKGGEPYQTAGGESPCRQTKGGEPYQTAGGGSPCRQTKGGESYQTPGGETSLLKQEYGEVQFTDYGLSGIPIFNLSQAAAGRKDLCISLDLLPQATDVQNLLANRITQLSVSPLPADSGMARDLSSLFTGIFQKRVGELLVGRAGYDAAQLVHAIHNLDFPVIGTMPWENAQVTSGGAVTAEFDPGTMASRLIPGLYACGEVLDVDGECGGYNLQWAWSTGILAGEGAAE